MSFSVSEADRRIANLIQIGTVSEIDAGNALAKVRIGDLTTPFIPVNALRAGAIQFWWMPSVGEQVLVAAPSGDIAQAVIVASYFAGNAPSADAAVPMFELAGGEMIINGDLYLNGDLVIDGNIIVTGDVTADGDVVAAGISLINHTHPRDGLAGNTGAPN